MKHCLYFCLVKGGWGGGRWKWKFQASSHGLAFQVTSPRPGAVQEHPPSPVTSVELRVPLGLFPLGIYQSFRTPESGAGAENSLRVSY